MESEKKRKTEKSMREKKRVREGERGKTSVCAMSKIQNISISTDQFSEQSAAEVFFLSSQDTKKK